MPHKYDVIVVGGGLGGLSAATCLAHRGFGVLLLEKHNVPGGYASSFVRGRYEFEVALHALSGMGTDEDPGSIRLYLDEVGVTDRVEFLDVPEFYRSVMPGLDLRVPIGWEAYEQTLCDAFPHEASGIRRFCRRVAAFAENVKFFDTLLYGKSTPGMVAAAPLHTHTMVRYGLATWDQVLSRDVKDPRAQTVISQIWGYLGLPPSQLAFSFMSMAVSSYVRHGATYIKGRSHALATAFVDACESHGGEVRLGCAVERILTRDGRVTGVITEHGEEFEADYVVANADPVTTCRDLIGADRVPEKFWRRLRSSHPGPSSFNVFLGLARPPEELGLTDHEVFINATPDMEAQHERMKGVDDPLVLVMSCYNNVFPDISPPGTSCVSATTLMYGEPWLHIPPSQYLDVKTRITDCILDQVEGTYPGVRDCIEVVEAATPLTNMRFTGQLGGSIYGFDQPPGDATIFRLPNKGPLKGLYFAGAWAFPGGGFEPAMTSGRTVGEMIAIDARGWLGRKGGSR